MITIAMLEAILLILAITFLVCWTVKQILAICSLIWAWYKIIKIFAVAKKDLNELEREELKTEIMNMFSKK